MVASGVAVRALAVGSEKADRSIYLTNASAPNQIFTISDFSPGATKVRMAAVAGTGAAGSFGDGGIATAAQLDLAESSPLERSAVAVAADGSIYVADTGNATIRAIAGPASSEPGVIRSIAGRWATTRNTTLVEPMGIALDRVGNLYIADHGAGAILMLPATGGAVETLAQVRSPASVAVTPDGATVFVASPETGAVFAIRTQALSISRVAGLTPSEPSTSPACARPPLVSPQLCPSGLAADGAGNLFISDANNGQILRLDASTSATSVVASGLSQPGALAIDASGSLFVAEQGANRIVAFLQMGVSQGSLSLAPASASYGDEPSGGATATQSFTVTNVSSSAITGVSVPKTTNPADFTVQTNNCTTTLPGNSSCTLSVAFTPTTTGARSQTLTVTDANPADSASTVLSGTGDDYQLQLASGQLLSVSVQAGGAATFNLQVVPDNVFSGTVTLVCPTNLPTNTTCTFSPPTVNVSAGTAAPFSVKFQTTGIVNPLAGSMPLLRKAPPGCLPSLVLAALAAIFLGLRRHLISPVAAMLAVFVAVSGMFVGCSKGISNASIGATPSGTSTMAVTGNSQNASRAVTITLNVVQE